MKSPSRQAEKAKKTPADAALASGAGNAGDAHADAANAAGASLAAHAAALAQKAAKAQALPPPSFIVPDWPAPPGVCALQTTRQGGASLGPFAGFNLGLHAGDDERAVRQNRALLRQALPAEALWLTQTHGNAVLDLDAPGLPPTEALRQADAAFTRRPGVVCAVMTADCLPVLLCDKQGSLAAAVHAGWRSLASGVLENTAAAIAAAGVAPSSLIAWLGPAISPAAFEVGSEVRECFLAADPGAGGAFIPGTQPGKWLADLFCLARRRLQRLGIGSIHGGGLCTALDPARFFSYRRDGKTGRMASLVWLA
jgi:YfiH family protein